MPAVLAAVLAATLLGSQPLAISAERDRDTLTLSVELKQVLPPSFEAALPSGALVRVVYQIQVRAERRVLWDRKIWKGTVVSTASFDPITGRYRCELTLDEIVVASREFESAEDARGWLTRPPPVRLALKPSKALLDLRVRARAVFSSTTVWLVFPATEGTEWIEAPVSSSDEDGARSRSDAVSRTEQ
jgi:hypothetical protein